MEKRTERGFTYYRIDPNTEALVTKWHVNIAVTVATNCSEAYSTSTARRYSQKLKRDIQVHMPKIISE